MLGEGQGGGLMDVEIGTGRERTRVASDGTSTNIWERGGAGKKDSSAEEHVSHAVMSTDTNGS